MLLTLAEIGLSQNSELYKKALKNLKKYLEENYIDVCIKEFTRVMEEEAGILITNDNVFWENSYFTFEGFVQDYDDFFNFVDWSLEGDTPEFHRQKGDRIKFKTEYGQESMFVDVLDNPILEEELNNILPELINTASAWMMAIEEDLKDIRYMTRYAIRYNFLFDENGNIVKKGD